ncbi:MAG: hypothetical protein FWB91_12840 [Defluviitaleaceae bacterium]|nr:hypothetical protein [Defluviitaleaceae bacterium]
MDSDINKLRAYFKGLNTPQKEEFIHNLQRKIAGVKNSKYIPFLAECKAAVADNAAAKSHAPKRNVPELDLTAEVFAKALATLIHGPTAKPSGVAIARRLVGRWQREVNGQILYYNFNADGSFETNEIPGHDILKGHYSTGIDGALLIEPHELIQFSSLMFSGDGSRLTIGLPDGVLCEYRKT